MTDPAPGIDFEKLTLKDTLDLAVLIEEEARDRYDELADQMEKHHTPEAARFFVFMKDNEEKHRAQLAARRSELFGDEASSVSPTMLFDVEAPEYHRAKAYMTAKAALSVALDSEKKAHAFFVRALEEVTDPDIRALLEELRDEEVEHQRLVRDQLAKAPDDPAFDPEDFEDDPVPL